MYVIRKALQFCDVWVDSQAALTTQEKKKILLQTPEADKTLRIRYRRDTVVSAEREMGTSYDERGEMEKIAQVSDGVSRFSANRRVPCQLTCVGGHIYMLLIPIWKHL